MTDEMLLIPPPVQYIMQTKQEKCFVVFYQSRGQVTYLEIIGSVHSKLGHVMLKGS